MFSAVVVVACGILCQSDPWPQLWSELEVLLGGGASEAEAAVLRAHLAQALHETDDDPRAELLRTALESLAGHDTPAAAAKLAALQPSPFSAREHWFLAEVLAPGPARARAVLEALGGSGDLTRWQFFLAWNTAVDEARAMRYEESTLPIQTELHERYQADWSALDLGLTYKSLGKSKAADHLLAETIGREAAAGRRTAHLWEQRGILALGSGDERAARDYLGKALLLGSGDAGLVLSRLDLMEGRSESARLGFRALLLDQPTPDWAWRGWGSALLPPAFAAPAVKNAPKH
jgi:hypothetical protein